MGCGFHAIKVHRPDRIDVLQDARELLAHHGLFGIVKAQPGEARNVADGGIVNHRRGTVAEPNMGDWYGRTVDAELDVIRRITARVGVRGGVHIGIGDDAAVLDDGNVLALDMVVDGVHVQRSTHSPGDIGHTALAVNLSDIAAMGAKPVAAVVGLGLPDDFTADDVEQMYDAMEVLAASHGMSVAGGDISASPVLTLSVAIIGRTAHGVRPVLRSGARAGHRIVVTGALGGSAAGRAILDNPALGTGVPDADALVACHLRPTPHVARGQHLAEAGAGAMMDISDGLLLDVDRLARASGLRAEIDLDRIPVAAGVAQVAAATGHDPALFAATGGEDYQLLATLPPSTGISPGLTVIGHMTDGAPGVVALRDGGDVTPERLGWEHGRV